MTLKPTALPLIFVVLLTMIASVEAGAMYKWVDQWGTTHFSDDPRDVPEGVEAKRIGGSSFSSVSNPHQNLGSLSSEVPYLRAGNSMIVNATINGVAMRMVLDTGASFVVIPPSVAKRAGIHTKGKQKVDVYTANGMVRVPKVMIREMRTGSMGSEDIPAVVQKIASEAPDVGLLGMSYLERFKFQIDQERNLLLLQKR